MVATPEVILMLSLSLLPHNPSKKFLLQNTLSLGYNARVALTNLPIGYSVIVALTGLCRRQYNSIFNMQVSLQDTCSVIVYIYSSNKSLYMIQCNSVSNRQLQDSVILALRGVGAKLEMVMFRSIQVLFPYMYGLLSHMHTGRLYAQQQLISCQLHLLGLVTLVDLYANSQLAIYTDVILQLMLTHIQPW